MEPPTEAMTPYKEFEALLMESRPQYIKDAAAEYERMKIERPDLYEWICNRVKRFNEYWGFEEETPAHT